MNFVVLSLGSNSADKIQKMKICINDLKDVFVDVKVSSVYETESLNRIDNSYLNAVLSGYCNDGFDVIKARMKQYEIDSGRTKESKLKGNVPIDIDIVLWNGDIIKENDFKQSYFQIGWNEIKEL